MVIHTYRHTCMPAFLNKYLFDVCILMPIAHNSYSQPANGRHQMPQRSGPHTAAAATIWLVAEIEGFGATGVEIFWGALGGSAAGFRVEGTYILVGFRVE